MFGNFWDPKKFHTPTYWSIIVDLSRLFPAKINFINNKSRSGFFRKFLFRASSAESSWDVSLWRTREVQMQHDFSPYLLWWQKLIQEIASSWPKHWAQVVWNFFPKQLNFYPRIKNNKKNYTKTFTNCKLFLRLWSLLKLYNLNFCFDCSAEYFCFWFTVYIY
jgi:hypothetical protein